MIAPDSTLPAPPLPAPAAVRRPGPFQIAAWIAAAAMLVVIVKFGLLAPLLAGMTMYASVSRLRLPFVRDLHSARQRQIALAIVSVIILVGLMGLGFWVADLLQAQQAGSGFSGLMLRISEIVQQLKETLPAWLTAGWPASVNSFNTWFGAFLREHAGDVQGMSQEVLHVLTRVFLGLVLGGVVAIAGEGERRALGPFATQLSIRVEKFFLAFRQVFFAQLKISLLNTFFTGIFLLGVLPLFGTPVPFAKTLLVLTFVAGLIPVLGNLISNTLITLIALSVSPSLALACLAFLIVIHKVEYFLNARIVGGEISARAWELLVSMIIMEALFGLPGVIAAPIFYAYVKDELKSMGWV